MADVDAGVDRPGPQPSSASLTRRSASAFCSRRTWRIDQLLEARQGPLHLGVQLAHRRVLDLVLALDLPHDQLRVADQLQLGRRPAPPPARSRAAAPGTRRRCWSPCRSARRAPRAPRRRRPATTAAIAAGPGLPAGAAVDVDDQLHRALSQPARRCDVGGARARRGRAARPRPPLAFHCRAEPSSWSTSLPLSIWKTGRSSSSRSTPHWYQESSQATVIRTSLDEPAAAPIETQGSPRVRVRPATVRAAWLALKRSTAWARRAWGDCKKEASGAPTVAPRAAGSAHLVSRTQITSSAIGRRPPTEVGIFQPRASEPGPG